MHGKHSDEADGESIIYTTPQNNWQPLIASYTCCQGPPQCFTCDKQGHLARNCRTKRMQLTTPTYFRCRNKGHLARDCKNQGNGMVAPNPSEQGVSPQQWYGCSLWTQDSNNKEQNHAYARNRASKSPRSRNAPKLTWFLFYSQQTPHQGAGNTTWTAYSTCQCWWKGLHTFAWVHQGKLSADHTFIVAEKLS